MLTQQHWHDRVLVYIRLLVFQCFVFRHYPEFMDLLHSSSTASVVWWCDCTVAEPIFAAEWPVNLVAHGVGNILTELTHRLTIYLPAHAGCSDSSPPQSKPAAAALQKVPS